MKTKNVMLGLVATVFAIGGAFASSVLVIAPYAKNGSTCSPIADVQCGNAGPRTCQVRINNVNYNAFETSSCDVALTTTLTAPIPSSFE
jgi:hypothetical protein